MPRVSMRNKNSLSVRKEREMMKNELLTITKIHDATPKIISRIINMALNSEDENIALKAATFLIERGWGKNVKRVEIFGVINKENGETVARDVTTMTPKEAYAALSKQLDTNIQDAVFSEIKEEVLSPDD